MAKLKLPRQEEFGRVLAVVDREPADLLLVDVEKNDLQIFLEDASEFGERGTLKIGNEEIKYTDVDDELGTVVLGKNLTHDGEFGIQHNGGYPEGTLVSTLVGTRRMAHVRVDDIMHDDPIVARVAESVVDRLDEGIRGKEGREGVVMELRGWQWVITDVLTNPSRTTVDNPTFSWSGNVRVKDGTHRWASPGIYIIDEVIATINTPPTGQGIAIDIKRGVDHNDDSGHSVFGTEGEQLVIPAGMTYGAKKPDDDYARLNKDSFLKAAVTQVGSVNRGKDLTVVVVLRRV